jgi:septal ring factor EnvC (AmiA/AmiB activator)
MDIFKALTSWMRRKRPKKSERITIRHLHSHLLKIQENQLALSLQFEVLMANSTDRLNAIAATLDNVSTEIDKISSETTGLLQAIVDLKAVIAAGGNSAEVDAAIAAVENKATTVATKLKTVDDLVEDAPSP